MSEENVEKEVTTEIKKDEGPGLYQIFVQGEITAVTAKDLFEQINGIPSGSNLMIWLNSNGGSLNTGLMLDDKLKAKNLNVTYISHLYNASLGCLLPHISDNIKLCYNNSVFTFHGASRTIEGREEIFNDLLSYADYAINTINDAVIKSVGLTKKEFSVYNSNDKIHYGYQLLNKGANGWFDGIILKEFKPGNFLIKTRDGNKLINVGKHKLADLKDLPVIMEDTFPLLEPAHITL